MVDLAMESRTSNHGLLVRSFHLNRRYLKISIALLVGVLILTGVYHVLRSGKARTNPESSYFTVILDCGSTGTRVNVYEFLRNGTSNQDQPILLHSFPDYSTRSPQHNSCEYHCMQTQPGLDKFLHNSSGISLALEPLLLWAEHQGSSQRHGETFVFLLATAGLRRLSSEDADWILQSAESVLKKHRFIYRRSWIRVLSGKEEAYYGWIALNYNLGRLGNTSMGTFGVLDLGGSSLQVVMETEESRVDQHFLKSKIGSVGHHLLAYSVPAFGLNEAFERSIALLYRELTRSSNGRLELRHPCLNSGFVQNYTCHSCYMHPNATNGLNMSNGLLDNQATFYLVGDPDWERCKDLTRATVIHSSSSDWLQLSADMACKEHSHSSGTGSQNMTATRPVARFHALSGFFAVYQMLDLNQSDNMKGLLERGQQLCSRPWEELKRLFSDQNFVEQFCFRPPYLVALVEDGLCLENADIIFGPGYVSWTLGAALVEAQYLCSNEEEGTGAVVGRFSVKGLEVISTPSLVFVLILCAISIVWCRQVVLHLQAKGFIANLYLPQKTGKLDTK